MKKLSRRSFLQETAAGAAVLLAAPLGKISPVFLKTGKDLILRPYPHPWMPAFNRVYLAGDNEDPFKSNVKINSEGVIIPEDIGSIEFSVNAKWFVEGFGYIMLSADNGGNYYTIEEFPENGNLNFEFAKSRVSRNRKVKEKYETEGTIFSSEVKHFNALSEELFSDALKAASDGEKCAELSDKALKYALWTGEKIELERAKSEIERQNRKDKFYFGCETRQYIWAKSEDMTKAFLKAFNFATITHYVWDTWYELFEPREGIYNWGIKDNIVSWLSENNVTIQGRPLFWFHPIVTPEWLKKKNFSELKQYVEKHTHDLVSHYGNKILHWEVVNEYHDWANIHNHTPFGKQHSG